VPNASDPDGDTLTFSVTNLPGWARFNTSTGELSGQPTLVDAGVYGNIRISVNDGSTTVELRPFSITVTQASLGSATLSIQAPATNTDGTPFTDLMAFKIYFGMTSGQYPNEIYINSPGISSYVVENLAPGSYYFVATAINGTGMESSFSNEVTRVVN
ncbi:MAG: putative Ig domain-containing protein, partial [Gammaproteobacteria bacterium]|nr:putative Ig domain-containing protein [Gammaproteobacteria bacterium]